MSEASVVIAEATWGFIPRLEKAKPDKSGSSKPIQRDLSRLAFPQTRTSVRGDGDYHP